MIANSDFLNKTIVLLGGPCSGKGTQTPLLSKWLGNRVIVAGDILREMSKKEKWISDIIDSGTLLLDEDTNRIIKSKIDSDKDILQVNSNYVIDGYPRSLKQATELDKFQKPVKAIWINVSDDILFSRLKQRAISQSRIDDSKEEFIKNRMLIYHTNIRAILEYYRKDNRLVEIDGNNTVEEVFNQIKQKI